MKYSELEKLEEINIRLKMTQNTLENIIPIWNAIDRKKQSLQLDIKILEDEKNKLVQGQLLFDEQF